MSRKEENLKERTLELWYSHEDWGRLKALSVAIREEREEKQKSKFFSIRQIGLLEYWD